jgi:hypothetical protein
MERYGERTTLAETIRRLLEEQLNILEIKSYNSGHHNSEVVIGKGDHSNFGAVKDLEIDALLDSSRSELGPIAPAIERLIKVLVSAALALPGPVRSPPLPRDL